MDELNVASTLNTTSEEYEKAVRLHRDVMTNGQLAADAFVEFCRCLKEMRDTKLFVELGYADFEGYTVQAVKLKQRQAYSYISTYERLGTAFLQSNATLGITKLELLASVPLFERDDVTEGNDLDGMSVSEVRELVAKYDASQAQLSLLQSETTTKVTDAQTAAKERDALLEEVRELKEQLAAVPEDDDELGDKIAELEDEIREREHAEMEKIRAAERETEQREAATEKARLEREGADKIKAATDKLNADAEARIKAAEDKAQESVAAATKQAQALARQQIEDSLAGIEEEKTQALARASELEQKLKVAANPDTTYIQFEFEIVQEAMSKITDRLTRMALTDVDTAEKFRVAARKLLDMLGAQI